jgi:oligopeptide/dipeptide ABC transporter ATP-binding protein
MTEPPILAVRDLTVGFRTESGWLTAIEGVSFDLFPREALGIVGESGSGKSVTALSLLRLHSPGTTRISSGSIDFDGRNLVTLGNGAMRRVRGGEIAMIFQDPMASLNPVLTIADQISETLMLHQGLNHRDARKRAIEALEKVQIADATRRVDAYPHQLSGGMRQRVMIAIAIACRPRILIADEPTTALDVTIQAQVLNLIRNLQMELGMSVILISHDLGVIAEFAQRVTVMYAGRIVEQAPVRPLYQRPMHPYTSGLIAAIPPMDVDVHRLPTIPGRIPGPAEHIPGCRFSPRCLEALDACRQFSPELAEVGPAHFARCPPRLARMKYGP